MRCYGARVCVRVCTLRRAVSRPVPFLDVDSRLGCRVPSWMLSPVLDVDAVPGCPVPFLDVDSRLGCRVPSWMSSPVLDDMPGCPVPFLDVDSRLGCLQSPVSSLQTPVSSLQSPVSKLHSPISNLPVSSLQAPGVMTLPSCIGRAIRSAFAVRPLARALRLPARRPLGGQRRIGLPVWQK